jgi:CheY-like chemotaxis protein
MQKHSSLERPSAHQPSRQAFPNAGPKSQRVLVVDDDVDMATLMVQLLKISGHQTRAVHFGLEVLEAARNFLPDVILLDIGLPDRNGYEVAQSIRRERLFQTTLLVAMTGWDRDEDRRAATAAGFDVHLAKPVNLDTLLKMLDQGSKGQTGRTPRLA